MYCIRMCFIGDGVAAQFLLERDCDSNAKLEPSQDSPLHLVAANDDLSGEIADLLVRKGAKVNAQNAASL